MPRTRAPIQKGPAPEDVRRAESLISGILNSGEQNQKAALLRQRVGLTALHRAIFMQLVQGDFIGFFDQEIKPVDEALRALGQTPEQIKAIGESIGRLARLHDGEHRIRKILERTGYNTKE